MNLILIETIETTGTEWGVSRTSQNPENRDYIGFKSYEDAAKFMDWNRYMKCERCNEWKHANFFHDTDSCQSCWNKSPAVQP